MCLDNILEGNMEKIQIGQIVNVVGLKGDIKIYSYSDDPNRFLELEKIFIEEEEHKIEKARYKGNMAVLKVEGIDGRDVALKYKGKNVFMSEDDLPQLPEGEYYVKDLIGFEVKEGEKKIGVLKDVLTNTAQSIYVVDNGEKNILIPGVKEFIIKTDVETKAINVKLPEGLLEI